MNWFVFRTSGTQRTAQYKTLVQLSAETGLSPSLLSEIRSGRVNPRDYELARIAAALGISPPSKLLDEVIVVDSETVHA